jgi:hypothetical protein
VAKVNLLQSERNLTGFILPRVNEDVSIFLVLSDFFTGRF